MTAALREAQKALEARARDIDYRIPVAFTLGFFSGGLFVAILGYVLY